jgi:hypothetical protein
LSVLQVQQLLAAAPEALKALGLAYRAFVIAPSTSADAAAMDSSSIVSSSTAAAQHQLLQRLHSSYRLYISNSAEYMVGSASFASPDGCNTFAEAVLGLSASVLLLLPHPGQGAAAAALSSCLPLLLAAVRKGVPVHCVGQPLEQQGVLEAAAAAGWSNQVCQGCAVGLLTSLQLPTTQCCCSLL